ncbi:hypothetical protein HNY73_022443 [Argiope bruennichi]|uniref:Tc1-like transposase DDE domain-containing protein n=1 Tax=Argiope bruennichi TaxID=94029 RepID=A0A8T0E549_ARGBR|nr:hypothetical protein HNY73_022443 [Argiope bruennichi]
MNFRWKKCANKRKFLIERPDIVFWRNNYLRKMRQYRKSKCQIVFIDETWVDSNLTFRKCWQSDTISGAEINVNSKNRLIIVHAGSSTGFIPGAQLIYKASTKTGDYHGQMNYENFEKWVLEKLIPNLRPKSVVCMDNAPYHTKVANPTPTKYIKRLIKERNITGDLSLENLQNLLCDALGGVSSKEWEAHCRHVEKLENSYWEKDGILEEVVDELVVQIGSTESDSDSEETESCDSDSEFF